MLPILERPHPHIQFGDMAARATRGDQSDGDPQAQLGYASAAGLRLMDGTNRSNEFGPGSAAPIPRRLCLGAWVTVLAVLLIGSVDPVHARLLADEQAARAAKTVWSGVYTD